jgi:hypothetical protein
VNVYPTSLECSGYGDCYDVNLANLQLTDGLYGAIVHKDSGANDAVYAYFSFSGPVYAWQSCVSFDRRPEDWDPWVRVRVFYDDLQSPAYVEMCDRASPFSGCAYLDESRPISSVQVRMGGHTNSGEAWVDKIVLRSQSYQPPTPTPTVTPTPSVTPTPVFGSYCCEVVCQDPGYNPWAGTIPVVEVGQGTCIEWAGADLSAVGLGSIPPMRICFAPIRFGVVGILGITVNLDVISLVLSAVVTLRLLWRS